jgi:hypothetical protein
MKSDLDVVLLCDDIQRYAAGTGWTEPLRLGVALRTAQWGVLTEHRFTAPSDLEIEIGVASPVWAGTEPLDSGTARVARDGLVVVYDPDGLLASLAAALPRS